MQIRFPEEFMFGTSTAAYQIETAFEHDWKGVKSRDGFVFDRTSDHDKRYTEDAAIIAHCAPWYRMSLMWSKLQREPYGAFDKTAVEEYRAFLDDLKSRGVNIMMVLHHFTNPLWFNKKGNWERKENIDLWVDFAKKLVDEFGPYVSIWNTFNEPEVYASNGWVLGNFPPFKKSILTAAAVVKHMGLAHNIVYDYIKAKYSETRVGISKNCVVFGHDNFLGILPAKISDWWFMNFIPSHFEKVDFFGMSYYCRIGHDPLPVTQLDTPEKLAARGKKHDDMWEYYPQGLKECMERYWKRYKKPIIITENGICTADDTQRVNAMKDYLTLVYKCMNEGIKVDGYFFWSTFDNFEWNLGPTFRFGLYEVDFKTGNRTKRPSADVYHRLAYEKILDV